MMAELFQNKLNWSNHFLQISSDPHQTSITGITSAADQEKTCPISLLNIALMMWLGIFEFLRGY